MFKQILTFSAALLLVACATTHVRHTTTHPQDLKRVNFFAEGKTQAAFKVTGSMDDMVTDGVVTAKKIGDDDVEITLLSGGLYRVLHAVVSPEGIAYRYLFKDVDNALIRGRISQLLDLLFTDPETYLGMRQDKYGKTTVTYKGPRAKETFTYEMDRLYPSTARTITKLNSAELAYADYMPISADGDIQVPHQLIYKDGKIILEMQLISLR